MDRVITSTPKFEPEDHQNNIYEAFSEFVEEFTYEYGYLAKDPPKDLSDAEKAAWVEQNKRKVFLGKFSSRNLQKIFEEEVPEAERSTIEYKDMIKKLKDHFEGSRNKTLANYEFHKLLQSSTESYDAFVTRVKKESQQCDFKCTSGTCNVRDTLVRDQIIIGTNNDEIRKNALKNQWNLDELSKNGKALEAAAKGAKQIKEEKDLSSHVSRIKKPGKYSRKEQGKENQNSQNKKPTLPSTSKSGEGRHCTTCSNKQCKGGKNCIAHEKECFVCGEPGHFKGAASCKGKKARRVNTQVSSSESSSSSEESIPESSSEEESRSTRRTKTRRVAKHVIRIRRTRRKARHVQKAARSPRYEVEMVVNGQITKAFADTGADIPVMSKSQAKALGLKLCKVRMKIHPYGSKPVKIKQCYIGTIMYGDQVINACIYIVKQEVEFLLSGRISEEFGIIEYNPAPIRCTAAEAGPCKSSLAADTLPGEE